MKNKTSRPSSRQAAARISARIRARSGGRATQGPARSAGRLAAPPKAARKAAAGTRKAAAAAQAAPSATDAAPVRIARVAKGKKPQYFSDPATDKLLWMTITLMEELSVTRDRLDAVEQVLEGRKVLKVAEIEGYVPRGVAAERRQQRRAQYVDRVLRAAQAELEELTGRDMPKTEAEVVAAVEA